jgi:hypothetical protein
MGMSEHQGAPTVDVINVPIPIDIEEIWARAVFNNKWLPPNRAKRSDRRVNTPWEKVFGFGEYP